VQAGTTYLKRKYPELNMVGMCHGYNGVYSVARVLGLGLGHVEDALGILAHLGDVGVQRLGPVDLHDVDGDDLRPDRLRQVEDEAQDAGVGGYAADSGCSVIIVINKWVLVENDTYTLDNVKESIHRRMKYLAYAPIVSVSALTGQRVSRLFELIRNAYEARHIRVPTGTLINMFVPDLEKEMAAQDANHRLGIRYITQARSAPPTFVVFNAGRERMHFSTERYLVNRLRERFGFFATPIRIQQRLKPPKTPSSKTRKNE
jgi:hypothetical protein